jgi:hypothetical protein
MVHNTKKNFYANKPCGKGKYHRTDNTKIGIEGETITENKNEVVSG